MASASKGHSGRVYMTLTEDEARTLSVVLAKVGGSHENSPRKHLAPISDALAKAGIDWIMAPEYKLSGGFMSSGFDFQDYPKPPESFTHAAFYRDVDGITYQYSNGYGIPDERGWYCAGSSSRLPFSFPRRPLVALVVPEAE